MFVSGIMAVVFQALSWSGGDSHTDDADLQSSDSEDDSPNVYAVEIFGKTQEGRSVYLRSNFTPYYFVELKPGTSHYALLDKIEDRVHDDLLRSKCEVVKRTKLYGFTNNQQSSFLKLVFANEKAMRKTGWYTREQLKLQNYELNLDPMLRFMHVTGVQATGWIRVSEADLTILDDEDSTTCDVAFSCPPAAVHREDRMEVAPFVMVSLSGHFIASV